MAVWTDIDDEDVNPESPITTSLMQALRDNPVAIAEGSSGAPKLAEAVSSLFSDTTEVGNVGAGADDLMLYTLPAAKMATDGDRLRITGFFKGNAADTFILRFRFGTSTNFILYSGAAIPNAVFYLMAIVDVVRTGATIQLVHTVRMAADAIVDGADTATETLSGAVVIKFTGENTTDASNDAIVQQYLTVELIPAVS